MIEINFPRYYVQQSKKDPGGMGAFNMPQMSEWKCHIFGSNNGITYTPQKGKEPNWFWRKMQYLCFGHAWVKESSKQGSRYV